MTNSEKKIKKQEEQTHIVQKKLSEKLSTIQQKSNAEHENCLKLNCTKNEVFH